MPFSLVLTTRPLRDARPLGSYGRDGKLYVSVKDNVAWRNGAFIKMQPSQRRVFCALAAVRRYVSHNDLFEVLYGGREDGGPECSVNAVGQRVYRLRQICGVLGVRVESSHGWGWRLVEVDAEMREAAE